MTDDTITCVVCHDDLSDDHDAYCSDECKRKNESPRTKHNGPSHYQMLRCAEITGISVGEQE